MIHINVRVNDKYEAGMHSRRFHYIILLNLQGQWFSLLVWLKTDFRWRPTAALQALDLKEACYLPPKRLASPMRHQNTIG